MEVSAVTHVLRYIRSKHLRILDITHTVGHQRYDSLLKYLQRHCGDMDVILSRPMFSGLGRISWTVAYRPYSEQRDDARWVQDITGCWPRARDSGILHVSARRREYIQASCAFDVSLMRGPDDRLTCKAAR